MNAKRIVLFLTALSFVSPVFAARDGLIVQRRQDRWEYADQQWTAPEKVTLNVHYRVPVIEVLGYLAVNYDDTQKLDTIVTKLRPIANRVKELAGDSYEGRTFPPELKTETQKLRTQMFDDVTAVYGAQVTQTIESYLERKYKSLSGVFSPLYAD